ncbi:hypothetical protein LAZ67_11001789 [Cordylochernes scorpioides]|uniref:Integrase catalytic domain-containing protein n=1 Tax=Cordylochernes scorpioides TaxID=51811 RepID=A0ABY6KYP5_9ARAC|nr:hypothetical protein LAZ67_11001789 [Cordylochernes scorpioides]
MANGSSINFVDAPGLIKIERTSVRFQTPGLFHQNRIYSITKTRKSKENNSYDDSGYICRFVCLVTRAVHLVVPRNASTSTFMAAFECLVDRRGRCIHLYSDKGTKFIRSNKITWLAFWPMKTQTRNSTLKVSTIWWAIGIWSKVTQHHLKRFIGENLLTYEELLTLFVQNEYCSISRALYPLSNDSIDQQRRLHQAIFH